MAREEAFVLVWTDAALYRSRSDRAPVHAYDFGTAGRSAHPGEVLVARLIEDDGDWLEVATGPIAWLRAGAEVHCVGSGLVDGSVTLPLWVRASDVAPVLSSRFTRAFPDGSSVDLLPGTPVIGRQPWVDGFLLPVDVPMDHVGHRYAPVSDPGPRRAGELEHVAQMKASLGGLPVAWAQPPWEYAAPPYISLAEHGGHIREANGCGTIELLFTGTLATTTDGPSLLGDITTGRDDRALLPRGTMLTWTDGAPAGEVNEDLRTKVVVRGDRRCFTLPLGLEWRSAGYTQTEISLCAAMAK